MRTPAEREAVAEGLDRAIAEAPEQSNELERVLGKLELGVRRDNMVFQEPKAYWGRATIDDRRGVWLRYSHPVIQDYYTNHEFRFRVVSSKGEYLGDTTWPPVLEGKVVRGHLLAMVFDEESLQVVPTVFRMAPAIPGDVY